MNVCIYIYLFIFNVEHVNICVQIHLQIYIHMKNTNMLSTVDNDERGKHTYYANRQKTPEPESAIKPGMNMNVEHACKQAADPQV